MSASKYPALTDEEVISEIKKRKIFFYIYVGIVTIMVVASAFRALRGSFDFMTFFPLIFVANSVMYWFKLKGLLDEGKWRGIV